MKSNIMSYDAINGARYYGVGNEYEGVTIASAVFALAVLLNYKKIPKWLAVVLSIIILVTSAMPSMGANVGGCLLYTSQIGCDYVATGHYARIEKDEETGRYLLTKSVTDKKDQTYALYNLTQDQLEHTLLPIGEFEKEKVREMAKELGLVVHNKPDSQEICFVKDNDLSLIHI